MMTCRRSEWEPFGLAGRGGAALVMGAALLLGGCGQGPNTPSSVPAGPPAGPTASTPATSAAPSSAPAALPEAAAPAAGASAGAASAAASIARAKLHAMSVPQLLAAARTAYAQHHLVAPAGDNAMEYYEAVLATDPGNQVARDALREAFPFGVPEVEKAISQNNFDDADREIGLLAAADPTNYTLTLLRSKLDAQKKLQAREQQQAQLQQQRKAAELAAAQQAAAAKAQAEKQAAKAAADQKAAAPTEVAAAPSKPVAPPPAQPAGETRAAVAIAPVAPSYPIEAARNQTSGYAVVEFTVSVDGSVENPHVIDSSPRRVFDSAAIEAVRRSRFKPALKDGKPVASTVRRRIAFQFSG